jgi:hypothetical protein
MAGNDKVVGGDSTRKSWKFFRILGSPVQSHGPAEEYGAFPRSFHDYHDFISAVLLQYIPPFIQHLHCSSAWYG